MSYRSKKQFIILLIFFFFLALIGYGVYSWYLKPASSCFDGIRNQDEQEVDCGGTICQSCEIKTIDNLEVVWAEVIASGKNRFDLAAKIRNPNPNYGVADLKYWFEIKDKNGQVIGRRDGGTFILPNSTKYIIENSFETSEAVVSANLFLSKKDEIDWQKLKDYQSVDLFVLNKKFDILNQENLWGKASGTVKNSTPFGFNKINVNIIIFDRNSKPIGAAKTEMNTLTAGEYRAFSVIWPAVFLGEVATPEMQAETNLFSDENYMEKYGEPVEP